MIICGLNKTTLLDYPGKVACTVFTGGCNYRCPFCQNGGLVTDVQNQLQIPEDALMLTYAVPQPPQPDKQEARP